MTEYIYKRERIADGIYSAESTGEEIVRCRDCKHYKKTDGLRRFNLAFCKFHNGACEPSGYCAWAERLDA